MSRHVRYHVTDGIHRATVILPTLLAIALGQPPHQEATTAIGTYLSDTLVAKYGYLATRKTANSGTSVLCQRIALEKIAAKRIRDHYWLWRGVE